ncbi:MAG: hypothetical protein U0270_31580 [Labilithrix sp.]
MRHLLRSAALGAVIAGASLMGATTASAQTSGPSAEVMIIQATKCTTKSIDPAIKTPPPSLGYDCLSLIRTDTLKLKLNEATNDVLPNNRTFQLVHTGRTPAGKYKVTANISNADGSAGFTKLVDANADPNQTFNVGGFSHNGGVLLLSVKIVP